MPTTAETAAVATMPRPWLRALVSLAVALHLLAVFVGPWAMPPARSGLSAELGAIYQPYLDVLCLNNGYRFFAPEPGPSHLVRYEITLADGSLIEGVFPDRQQHQPRLLYHRHFMLSEFLNTLGAPGAPREPAEAYAKAYAQHLLDEHDGRSVKLYLRRHYVPRPTEVQQGLRLSDKSLYEEQSLGTYTRDEP